MVREHLNRGSKKGVAVEEERYTESDVARGHEGLLDVAALKKKKVSELHDIAKKFKIGDTVGLNKQDLIFKILQGQAEQ